MLPGYVIVCSYFHYRLINRVQLKHEHTVESLILFYYELYGCNLLYKYDIKPESTSEKPSI